MKKIIFLCLLFISSSIQAQFSNRQNQRQRQYPQAQETRKPKFDAKKYVGFVYYDVEKAAKKTGVKTSSDVGKKFVELLKEYNNTTRQIERINSFTLKSMKELVEATQKKVMDGGDPATLQTTQKTVEDSFRPIVKTLKEERTQLTKTLEELLSKKQFKKWQKFDNKTRK